MINGFNPTEPKKTVRVPAGLYIGKVVAVTLDKTASGSPLLKVAFDITEGEYKDAYKTRFLVDKEYAKKNPEKNREPVWKCIGRFQIPDGQDAQADNRNRRRLETFLWKIEKCNPNYKWNGDENTLVGKAIGLNLREAEFNGMTFTEFGGAELIEDIRNGTAKPMPRRENTNGGNKVNVSVGNSVPSGFTPVQTELPF